MIFSSCLTEEDSQLVLDSSVVINLLATSRPIQILGALAVPAMVAESVVREIEDGEVAGRKGSVSIGALIDSQVIDVAALDEDGLSVFAALVSGTASESLGDGEAATIATALAVGGSAVIDEKKATRLSQERYGGLRLATTLDLLAHQNVLAALGKTTLAQVTFSALQNARMQVREHQFDWVLDLIGAERAASCPSLRRLTRRLPVTAMKAAG